MMKSCRGQIHRQALDFQVVLARQQAVRRKARVRPVVRSVSGGHLRGIGGRLQKHLVVFVVQIVGEGVREGSK